MGSHWLKESWQICTLVLHGNHLGEVALPVPAMRNVSCYQIKPLELRASVAATAATDARKPKFGTCVGPPPVRHPGGSNTNSPASGEVIAPSEAWGRRMKCKEAF
jgi:hypothetical protein